MFNEKDHIAVNTIRALSIEQIEKAKSGHPGLPMGAAPMAYALFAEHLRVNAQESAWMNRDRFVLSAGHGSAMLYSLLHLSGFDVTIEDLQNFRQWGSRTPGHPEVHFTDGVEATTGPLGQGIAQAVGMAMAEAHLAAVYNKENYPIIDHYTYTLVGDGDLMEGISYEAISYAGRQELDKLIVLYDSNDISLDGDLDMAFKEDIKGRFESANWHYQRVEDGNDLTAISEAIQQAKEAKGQPSMIEIKTVIGYGSPEAGTHKVHGAPLGEEKWASTREVYGWESKAFEVPEEAQAQFDERVKKRGLEAYEAWTTLFSQYKEAYPEEAHLLELSFAGELPEDYAKGLTYVDASEKAEASRVTSGKVIAQLGEAIPYLWGGSADLASSNKSLMDAEEAFMPESRSGRNIWFGVREFAMAAMMNGIMLHGGSRVYGGTFFVFSDYLRAAVRLAALSKIPATYVMTHDSVAVGEDGPTHEPIEQLAGFRAMPNLNLIRPADANETIAAWKQAVEAYDHPTMLVLSRQNLPVLEGTKELAEAGVERGAYILSAAQGETPHGLLLATGSEVNLALQAQDVLRDEGYDVAVISMPSQFKFDLQGSDYQEQILPNEIRNRMSIEMGASTGWHKYIGLDGKALAIDTFGSSAPGDRVIEEYGFTVDNIVREYKLAFGE